MEFTLTPNTAYASSDRERYEDVLADYDSITGSEMAVAVLESFQDPLIVLNEKRQIVFMNRAFMMFLALDRPSEILGYRLGEVLGCTQAAKDLGGCGTRESCRRCGVVNAMLAALNGAPSWEKARIEVEKEDSRDFLEFVIEAAPVSLLSRQFVRLSLRSCSTKG
jgi:hypothetical protein